MIDVVGELYEIFVAYACQHNWMPHQINKAEMVLFDVICVACLRFVSPRDLSDGWFADIGNKIILINAVSDSTCDIVLTEKNLHAQVHKNLVLTFFMPVIRCYVKLTQPRTQIQGEEIA